MVGSQNLLNQKHALNQWRTVQSVIKWKNQLEIDFQNRWIINLIVNLKPAVLLITIVQKVELALTIFKT